MEDNARRRRYRTGGISVITVYNVGNLVILSVLKKRGSKQARRSSCAHSKSAATLSHSCYSPAGERLIPSALGGGDEREAGGVTSRSSPAVSMAGRRAVAAAVWLVLLMSSWLCFSSGAVAIRISQGGGGAGALYGRGRTPLVGRRPVPFGPRAPPAGGSVEESKRRVPSCPDPLHNRREEEQWSWSKDAK